MSTDVKHGLNPQFDAQLSGGEFSLTVVGHYTTTPGLSAGGVTEFKYESEQASKRSNELLSMRTIFLDWWLNEWQAQGGNVVEAGHIVGAICTTPLRG
jgi:hypothetical protein